MNLLEAITNKHYRIADEILKEEMNNIVGVKLNESKKRVAADMAGNIYVQTERQRRLRMDVLEQDNPVVKPLEVKPSTPEDGEKLKSDMESLKRSTDDSSGFQQQRRLRAGLSQIAEDQPKVTQSTEQEVSEEELHEARIKLVKARIRGGKVQRRKKVSNVPGFTLRGGQLTRMSASERRRRKLGAKKAARKSRMKKTQILRKRKMSLMKRQRLGI